MYYISLPPLLSLYNMYYACHAWIFSSTVCHQLSLSFIISFVSSLPLLSRVFLSILPSQFPSTVVLYIHHTAMSAQYSLSSFVLHHSFTPNNISHPVEHGCSIPPPPSLCKSPTFKAHISLSCNMQSSIDFKKLFSVSRSNE